MTARAGSEACRVAHAGCDALTVLRSSRQQRYNQFENLQLGLRGGSGRVSRNEARARARSLWM